MANTTDTGYFVTAELRVTDPGGIEEARRALADLVARTIEEPGCLVFSLHQDKEDPGRFMLWEWFRDEAAFKAHLAEAYTAAYFARGLTEVVRAVKSRCVAAPPPVDCGR